MTRPQHIGIVACSAEGAAPCYRTICHEGSQLLGAHAHPEVSLHCLPLADYVSCLDRDDLAGVAVIDSFEQCGCDAVVLGCTEIPLIIHDGNSALPTLDSTRLCQSRRSACDRNVASRRRFRLPWAVAALEITWPETRKKPPQR